MPASVHLRIQWIKVSWRLCLYCRAAVFWRFQVFQFYNFFVQWKNATWKLERQSLPAIPNSKTRLFNINFNFCWLNQDFRWTNDNHWWLKYCVHKNEHWWAKIPRKVPWFILSDICKIWPYYKCNESWIGIEINPLLVRKWNMIVMSLTLLYQLRCRDVL